jgi:plasmid replication initiation protein
MTGLKINGEYRGDPWGAVVLAEWHIEQGGAVTRLLIPPAAIQAIRAPETFAKIEAFAAYKLKGAARRLYAALADKKRMRESYWVYGLDELRQITGVAGKSSYERWNNFRQWVLAPALEQINDFGTVRLKMTPEKVGRSITSVRFDWDWKSVDEARVTEEENEQPAGARHMDRSQGDAPPLTEQQMVADREEYQNWQRDNQGGAYGDFLAWKKSQTADAIMREGGFGKR